MTVLNRLACALNRRDEVPNVELAKEIVRANDGGAVQELVDNLSNKVKNIQADCIKVLYEIGERAPNLIGHHYRVFGNLLDGRNNRLVWGAMTALDSIALVEPKGVYSFIDKILAVAETGTVITRDHAVGILAKLGTLKKYRDECLPLLINQLSACPNNQFPMYAEISLIAVTDESKKALHKVISSRLDGLEKESQKKRVLKVLRRFERSSGPTHNL